MQKKLGLTEDQLNQMLEYLIQKISPAPIVKPPKFSASNLCTIYPIADAHVGLYVRPGAHDPAWGISQIKQILIKKFAENVKLSPPSSHAVLAILGDFTHYEGHVSQNKIPLDQDGTYSEMLEAAFEIIKSCVILLLRRHRHVHISFSNSNYPHGSATAFRVMFSQLYRYSSRVTVDQSNSDFQFYGFGKNAFLFTHCDKLDPKLLPGILARDRKDLWGGSLRQYIFYGHPHERRAFDFQGSAVESVRTIAPADAYGQSLGYNPIRELIAITYHKRGGEHVRYTSSYLGESDE